jgi:hypothetical protein
MRNFSFRKLILHWSEFSIDGLVSTETSKKQFYHICKLRILFVTVWEDIDLLFAKKKKMKVFMRRTLN